jgi:hypothetical protein
MHFAWTASSCTSSAILVGVDDRIESGIQGLINMTNHKSCYLSKLMISAAYFKLDAKLFQQRFIGPDCGMPSLA